MKRYKKQTYSLNRVYLLQSLLCFLVYASASLVFAQGSPSQAKAVEGTGTPRPHARVVIPPSENTATAKFSVKAAGSKVVVAPVNIKQNVQAITSFPSRITPVQPSSANLSSRMPTPTIIKSKAPQPVSVRPEYKIKVRDKAAITKSGFSLIDTEGSSETRMSITQQIESPINTFPGSVVSTIEKVKKSTGGAEFKTSKSQLQLPAPSIVVGVKRVQITASSRRSPTFSDVQVQQAAATSQTILINPSIGMKEVTLLKSAPEIKRISDQEVQPSVVVSKTPIKGWKVDVFGNRTGETIEIEAGGFTKSSTPRSKARP
ncbi:MAG: hypothetical protein GY820_41045 [Gammaproteobacteria bacterium]|nr:hypothetical protein [Gammaproteobacteria bacterium]